MEAIQSAGHSIYFESGLVPLKELLAQKKYSKVFVFADRHTAELCIPVFRGFLTDLEDFDIIETDPGEENKNIDFCIGIWKTLLDFGADRKCLLINVGGGVITDMGGFVASTYKRGIDFINIPTTLLSQVDASVGGKTGIDIDHVKNMVGTFSLPKAVFIENIFLKTLDKREMLSGFAEMLKHGLIADAKYYDRLKESGYLKLKPQDVYHSVSIKNNIVAQDPHENGLRKVLNFGHTIGHAVESYALSNDRKPLTHGEAIAIGMIAEAYLSTKCAQLSTAELADISKSLADFYPNYQLKEKSFDTLLNLMLTDKKNEEGVILFSLLDKIGQCTFNCKVTNKDIVESLLYYNSVNGTVK